MAVAPLLPTMTTVGSSITTLFSPTVSSAAFGAFHCRRAVADSRPLEYRAFLWDSPAVTCGSGEAQTIQAAAAAILVLWAAAPLAGIAFLLYKVRPAVLKRTPSHLSTASRPVWEDFEPPDIWWAWMDLARRLALGGGLLLVPEEFAFLRLVAGLMLALMVLFMQAFVRPYRNKQVEALAAAVQTAVCVLILGYSYIYAF